MKLPFSRKFSKKIQEYQIAWKSVQWEPSCCMRTYRRIDKHDEAHSRSSQVRERTQKFQILLIQNITRGHFKNQSINIGYINSWCVFWKTRRLHIYRVSREECKKLRGRVPYVKIYRYNPKNLYPKLNGYGDNGQRKVWTSLGSTHCTCQLTASACPSFSEVSYYISRALSL
jgi:hypothetical protein